jgi:hypothetical protein
MEIWFSFLIGIGDQFPVPMSVPTMKPVFGSCVKNTITQEAADLPMPGARRDIPVKEAPAVLIALRARLSMHAFVIPIVNRVPR